MAPSLIFHPSSLSPSLSLSLSVNALLNTLQGYLGIYAAAYSPQNTTPLLELFALAPPPSPNPRVLHVPATLSMH